MRQVVSDINQYISQKSENVIYLLLWVMVLMGTLFSVRSNGDGANWTRILLEGIRLSPFLIVFFVNNTILSPYLLLKKKLLYYLLAVTILIIVVVTLSPYIRYFINWVYENLDAERVQRRFFRSRSSFSGEKAIMAILVVGVNNTIKLLIQRQEEETRHEEQSKLLLQTELSFLRNQISPHFFMNTLNNIHALIAIDPDKAGKSVIQLSALMRHMLSEANSERASIKDEFEFLNSYINLMRLRFSKRVCIDVAFDVEDNERLIPSFLFVSIVENAFKYGVDYSKPSLIKISASIVADRLVFNCQNSKSDQSVVEQTTGLGLDNLRKQLDLLYKADYTLAILDENDQFCVELEIPLNHD